MRNLKKALSLALASVMLLGMMVVGTSAAYDDVAATDNVEAIEVLKAVGVMSGDENGNFNPANGVTRNEMAVIMSNLLDLDTAAYSGTSPFADLPAWAEPYVAACYANGIVSGTSATTYGGNGGVTAAQAALMIMKALGYFQFPSDFGTDWQLATVKQADKIDLFAGIDTKVTAALTRNEAAQLVLNALKADMVDTNSTGGTTVTTPDGTVVSTGSVEYNPVVKGAAAKYAAIDATKDDTKDVVQLGEDLFGGDLKKGRGTPDDLGHPATKWTYKNKEVGVYADAADYVVTATKAYSGAVDAYKDLVDEDYKGTRVATKYLNGDDTWNGTVAKGDVIEFYLNDAGTVTHAINVRYTIGEVTKVDTKVSKADKEDDVTAYVTVKTIDGSSTLISAMKDTNFEGFDYAKDDVILFAQNGGKVLASKLASSVEGKVTSATNSKVAVDGTYYEYVGSKPALDAEGTFYLNAAGQIMDFDATVTKSGNYAYIYNVNIKDGLNAEGINGYTTTVYYVDQAGVKASAVVDATIDDSDPSNVKAYYDSAKTHEVKNGVEAFKINSDGEFETTTAEDTVETAVNPDAAVNKDNAVITSGVANANGATKFIFVEETATKVNVKVVEGYKNVKIAATATVTAITDSDNYAVYAFVNTANGNVEATGYVAVLLSTDPVETKDDDNTYWEFAASVNGEDTTITTKTLTTANCLKGLSKGYVISYNLEDGYVIDVNTPAKTGISFTRLATVSAENDDYVVIGGAQYNLGTETMYTIVKDYKADGTLDTVTVTAGGEFSTDNKVTFTTKDGDLDIVFVIEEIK